MTETRTAAKNASASGPWSLVERFGPFVVFGGLVLYVIVGPRFGTSGPSGEEIPAYEIADGATPDVPLTRLRIARGSAARWALVLRPSKPPATKIVAYVFSTSENGGDPEPVDAVRIEVAPDGLIKMAGSARPLEGVTELRLVIGAPSAFAKFDDAAAHAKRGRGNAIVQVTVIPIDRDRD